MESEVPCVDFVYQRLVQLVARAFYSVDLNILLNEEAAEATAPPSGSKRKRQPVDFTGLGVVVMDALMHRPWWEEEEFARKLGLPARPVRQVLRLLETHSLVAREHRKEKKRKADANGEAGNNTPADGDVVEESMQERGHVISYCSLDYQAIFDVTRFRLHKIRRKLKEELEDRRAVAEYLCAVCDRSYTTLQAPFLIKADGLFHCEDCDTVLESATDGQADGLSRRERNKAVKAKQAKLEEELKPLTQLLTDIERRVTAGEEIPDFGTLAAWAANEARRSGAGPQAARRAGGSRGAAAEARIDVSIEGPETAAAAASEAAAPRELPPWLQRQDTSQAGGTNTSYSLSEELAGEAKDVKSASPGDTKKLEEAEYMQQYKVRMEQMAAQQAQLGGKWQSEGGWQEVDVAASAGGWEEVKPPAAVKQEPGQTAAMEATNNPNAGGAEEDEDEWEDA